MKVALEEKTYGEEVYLLCKIFQRDDVIVKHILSTIHNLFLGPMGVFWD